MESYSSAKKLEKRRDPWASKHPGGVFDKSMLDLRAAQSGDLR